jgi:hypothetical protein
MGRSIMNRRNFVKKAGTAVTGAAALGVAGASANAEPEAEVTEPSAAVPSETLVAYVRDVDTGEVTVASGTGETTYRDKALVKRLVKAARSSEEVV